MLYSSTKDTYEFVAYEIDGDDGLRTVGWRGPAQANVEHVAHRVKIIRELLEKSCLDPLRESPDGSSRSRRSGGESSCTRKSTS